VDAGDNSGNIEKGRESVVVGDTSVKYLKFITFFAKFVEFVGKKTKRKIDKGTDKIEKRKE